MNLIICTDSQILCSRLINILTELPHVRIAGITKNLDESEIEIRKNEAQVFITAFHRIQKTVFKKLNEIKKYNSGLVVIVLTNNTTDQYLLRWKKAGADYVLDQAMHFSMLIEILAQLIYENILKPLKSSPKPNEPLPAVKAWVGSIENNSNGKSLHKIINTNHSTEKRKKHK